MIEIKLLILEWKRQMGAQETRQAFEAEYSVEEKSGHPFFREYAILTHKKDKRKLLRKHFNCPKQQAQKLKREFEMQDKAAFSLITPTKIIFNEGKECYCSQSYEISIYFEWLEKSLESQIAKKGKLDNNQALFLLGEVSKGIQYMEDRGRAHYCIAPNTVFINSYENHFLYDSLYVIGLDTSSFLQTRTRTSSKHQCPLTPNSYRIISKLKGYQLEEASKQDMFDFGLTMLFAITGYKLERLPKILEDREKKIRKLLNSCVGEYEEHLLGAISRMVGLPGQKPITNHELRKILDETSIQSKIIKAEARSHSLKRSGVSDHSLSKSRINGTDKTERTLSNLTGPRKKELSSSQMSQKQSKSFGGVLSGSTIGAYRGDDRLCYSQDEVNTSSFYQPLEGVKFRRPNAIQSARGVVIYHKIDEKQSELAEESEIERHNTEKILNF